MSGKVTFVLPPTLWSRLALAAAQVGVSRATFVRMALLQASVNPRSVVPFDPNVDFANWLAAGHSREVAYERTKGECEDKGIEWEPVDGGTTVQ